MTAILIASMLYLKQPPTETMHYGLLDFKERHIYIYRYLHMTDVHYFKSIYTYLYTHVHTHMLICVSVCSCKFICLGIYIYMYICAHTTGRVIGLPC